MWIRLQWTKLGKIRWTSHRDAARIFERALRRAEFRVAYSTGFSPRPRMSFGLALPTGAESVAEFLEVDLVDIPDPDRLADVLTGCLPVGMTVVSAEPVAAGALSLQQDVVACEWELYLEGLDVAAVSQALAVALERDRIEVMRERKGAQAVDDIRSAIDVMTVERVQDDGCVVVRALTTTKPRGVRPADLAAAVVPGATLRRAIRTTQFVTRDGEPVPLGLPLDAGATL